MEKSKGILWQCIAYTLAVIAAVLTFQLLPEYHLIIKFLLADIVATVIIFIFSRITNNSSFYDPFWSLQPIVIALALFLFFISDTDRTGRPMVVLVLIAMWGLRLTYNFLRGWKGLKQQDWRYEELAAKHGKNYWWVSFSGIHMLPTILVFGGCLPLFAIFNTQASSLNFIDIIALLICFSAIIIEATADQQLHKYKKSNPPANQTFSGGLWSKVRHPNYLGEVSFWWGLFLFGLAANIHAWWYIIGALSITILFVYISIPMIDNRMLVRRDDYKQHMDSTPALFPKFFR
jgi:steroid 5-alpha reductase family enzyme